MATYWNATASGYINSTYCYGYYQGQYYANSKYVVSGNQMDWAYYDSGVNLKLGNSSDGYYWQSVNAKRVYTQYKDAASGFDSGTSHYAYFYWTNSTTTTTIKSYSDVGITAPVGKKFKEWNTAEDGSGDSYAPGDTITDKAGNINSYKLTRTLYAIWEWDGVSNIGGKNAICYICTGHNEDNSPVWRQVLPYVYCKDSKGVLDWRMGVGGST